MAGNEGAVVGVLAGISYVSGMDYYEGINKMYIEHMKALECPHKLMPPNPVVILVSADCDEYAYMLTNSQWSEVRTYLTSYVRRLVNGGADFLCIASNTGHIAVPEITRQFPCLPVLHIADVTASAIRTAGVSTVGLLGTKPTMTEPYLKDQLALHGISTLVPLRDEDQNRVFSCIMHELGFNIFTDETRAFFVQQVLQLVERGAEGVVLGCTEIELLELQEHVPDVPLFRSAQLHIEAVARVQAGLCRPEDYMPPQDQLRLKHARAAAARALDSPPAHAHAPSTLTSSTTLYTAAAAAAAARPMSVILFSMLAGGVVAVCSSRAVQQYSVRR